MKRIVFTLIITVALIISVFPAEMLLAEENEPDQAAAAAAVTIDKKQDVSVAPESSGFPVKLSAIATKKATIEVRWNKIPGAKSYKLYRATAKTGEYKCIKNLKSTKFTDKKIHPKNKYFYKITTIMPADELSVCSYDSNVASAKLKIKKSFKVKAYAYTGGGGTKIGKKAMPGRIAVDPKVIKLGTWLYVEGYGICQACDIGGNIKGKTIDVYKNSWKQVRNWGVRKPKVYIIG